VRNYWTNVADYMALECVRRKVERPINMHVNSIMDAGRTVAKVVNPEIEWQYPCNVPGEQLSALPTLVAYTMSRGFRPGKPGAVRDRNTK
jgi:hypothetical protein